MRLKSTMTLVATAAMVFSASAFANTVSVPVSAGEVTPYIINGENSGGNRTCAEVGTAFFGNAGYYEFSSDRVNFEGGSFVGEDPFPAGLTVNTDGTYVSFTSTFGIGAVIVKGGADANVYVYELQSLGDSGLASPFNASNSPAGLSNLTFCWNPEEVEDPGNWCSPGYWRQPHHLYAWEPTGYSPDDKFQQSVGYYPALSKQGAREGAPTDPTLIQVLTYPQWYGGSAFNAVGDLLSAAHPDVNFLGERVEDSCPLN